MLRLAAAAAALRVLPQLAALHMQAAHAGSNGMAMRPPMTNHKSQSSGDDSLAFFGVTSGSVTGCVINDGWGAGMLPSNLSAAFHVQGNTIRRTPIYFPDKITPSSPPVPTNLCAKALAKCIGVRKCKGCAKGCEATRTGNCTKSEVQTWIHLKKCDKTLELKTDDDPSEMTYNCTTKGLGVRCEAVGLGGMYKNSTCGGRNCALAPPPPRKWPAPAHTSKKTIPNILFVLSDDLGFNDVSLHGSDQIPTPHIDALAATGLTLMNYHANPSCRCVFSCP